MNDPNNFSFAEKFNAAKDDYPIFASEIDWINRRRKKRIDASHPLKPGTQHNLVGLALSGGGIRSATFNLGFLQALCRKGVLGRIDYLSTVSGGGFIGSCLTSLLSSCDGNQDDLLGERNFPFSIRSTKVSGSEGRDSTPPDATAGSERHTDRDNNAGIEKEPVRQLRYYSNYLTTAGHFIDKYVRPALVFLRGMVLNFLTIVPYMIAIAILLSFVFTMRTTFGLDNVCINNLLFDLHKFETALNRVEEKEMNQWAKIMDQTWYLQFSDFQERQKFLSTMEAGDGEVNQPEMDDQEKRLSSEWRAVWLSPLLLFSITMIFALCCIPRGNNFDKRFRISKRLGWGLLFSGLILLVNMYGAIIVKVSRMGGAPEFSLLSLLALLTPKLLQAISTDVEKKKKKPWIKIATAVILLALVPLVLLFIVGIGIHYLTVSRLEILGVTFPTLDRYFIAGAAAVILFVISYTIIDINRISWHNFYRDRLSRAYLMQPVCGTAADPFEKIDHRDELKLSAIGEKGPYHLLNVNLNMTKEPPYTRYTSASGRETSAGIFRTGESFILSKFWCGSEKTGYRQTAWYENRDDHLDLGTAMAVSGGAASVGMGLIRLPFLRLLMGLLNIRLSYWAPHPGKGLYKDPVHTKGAIRRRILHPCDNFRKNWLSLREWFVGYNNDAKFINLSDGGHFENLGVYELLRRRCKYILVSDAEADPEMSFNGLSNLIRLAHIDFGIDIDINIDDIRRDKNTGRSRNHCAIGEIHYPAIDGMGAEKGFLLYCKSSLTGDEPEHLNEYKVRHSHFPHELTADQWFDEQQFEAYRELGNHIGTEVFPSWLMKPVIPSRELFDLLKVYWHPRGTTTLETQFPELIKVLGGIIGQIKLGPGQSFPDEAISPRVQSLPPFVCLSGTPDKGQSTSVANRKGIYMCTLMMRLMENIYRDLDLEHTHGCVDNMDLINSFKQWFRNPLFMQAWGKYASNTGQEFQLFCRSRFMNSKTFAARPRKQRYDELQGGHSVSFFLKEVSKKDIIGKWTAKIIHRG